MEPQRIRDKSIFHHFKTVQRSHHTINGFILKKLVFIIKKLVFILKKLVFILKKLVFILKKIVFILNKGLMSKTGFYSEKLVSFIFILYSKTENILSVELQCMNIPTTNRQQATSNTTTLQKKKKTPYQFYCRNLKPNITSILGFVQSSLKLKMKPIRALPISSIRKRNKSIIRLRFMFHKKKKDQTRKKF